jgi:hypothetical protein
MPVSMAGPAGAGITGIKSKQHLNLNDSDSEKRLTRSYHWHSRPHHDASGASAIRPPPGSVAFLRLP